ARESACECERSSGLQLGPVMALINGQTIADAIADPNNALAKLAASETDDAKLVGELFLRVLNRPATEAEIQACVKVFREPEADHAKLVAALKAREAEVVPIRAKQETDREAAIVKARDDLAAYEKQIAPKVAEAEKQRAERIAKAEAAVKAYEAALPAKLAEWEKKQTPDAEWVV